MRCFAFSLTAIAMLYASPGGAQVSVTVTHGQGGSGITGYVAGKSSQTYPSPQPWITLSGIATGDSVCFDVIDAHSVFYNYTVGVTVDTASERLPDVSSAVGLLKQAISATGRGGSVELTLDAEGAYTADFYRIFSPLADSIVAVQADIERSDTDGIQVAKAAVKRLPSSPTSADLDAWVKDATNSTKPTDKPADKSTLASDAHNRLVIAALKAYGQTLLSTREALRGSYAPSIPVKVRTCGAVGAGKTTIRLDIKKKTAFGARDAKDGIATVVVTPRYERSVIEAMPILFAAFVHDRPEFSLQNGIVRRTVIGDSRIYRPGGVIALNLPPSEAFAYGPFIGFGVTSENKLSLSDFLGGALFSYNNQVRFGVGYGNTTVVTGIASPAVENQPLDGTTKLEDLLVKGDKRAWYLLIALPSLTLKSPWP